VEKILVLIGGIPNSSSGGTLTGENSYLKNILDEHVEPIELNIISFGFDRAVDQLHHNITVASARVPAADKFLSAIGGRALYARLATFPIGRLINSMGPLDQGRVFWRYVRRNAAAYSALKSADVIVAADLAAVKTAWLAHKRGWCSHAEYDTRAQGIGASFAQAASAS